MDRAGVQGGTIPIRIGNKAAVEPYGWANDEYQADDWFADYLTASMGYLMKRFKGHRKNLKDRRNGGIGAFTPDNVPVFDWRSEEQKSERQSIRSNLHAVLCWNKQNNSTP